MSFLFFRNRTVPYSALPDRLHQQREAAIVFTTGGSIAQLLRLRASHRCDLPDVDLSRIVRVEHASFWGRLAEAFGLVSPRYELAPEEWHVIRPASDLIVPVRPGENVIPINRAA